MAESNRSGQSLFLPDTPDSTPEGTCRGIVNWRGPYRNTQLWPGRLATDKTSSAQESGCSCESVRAHIRVFLAPTVSVLCHTLPLPLCCASEPASFPWSKYRAPRRRAAWHPLRPCVVVRQTVRGTIYESD